MLLGINAGFGEPIACEFPNLTPRGFTIVRQDLRAHFDDDDLRTLVHEFAGAPVVPLVLLAGGHIDTPAGDRVEPHEIAALGERVVAFAADAGLTTYWIEVGNEPDLAHIDYRTRPADFAIAVGQTFDAVRAAGFLGPVVSGGICNLSRASLTYLERMLNQGLPADVVCLVTDTSRDSVKQLGRARGLVDLLIPRGGAGLIQAVVSDSQVPVIETGVGNCHVYVDRAADLDMATRIVTNAKVQRPSVCNAAETLLVHRDVAAEFLPAAAEALRTSGVELRGDDETRRHIEAQPADDEDWDTEFLDLTLVVAVVSDVDAAMAHIATHGTRHTEAIVTQDRAAARRFVAGVDAAAVMVNASTRFTDGGEFGFGAEIGISTQKLHARGPMGLTELVTTKYIVEGDGQVRA